MNDPSDSNDPAGRSLGLKRALLVAVATALALAAALVWLLVERSARSEQGPRVLTGSPVPRPEGEALDAAMQAAIDAMVAEARGIMDNHPDPDVGRVLQPRLQGAVYRGAPVSTNDEGMREGLVERPKPAGRVRIALLGDSYVFGWGVSANERVGRHLQRHLRRELPDVDLEVLSFAVPSWNLRAQCAWLRRQAALLEADLVVVHVCDNDLDDNLDVRGFGALAGSSSQRRARADAIVWRNFPVSELAATRSNPLLLGRDHESRARWAAAVDDVAALRDAVAAAGGRTVLLMNTGVYGRVARERLVEPLGDVPAVWIPPRFATDPGNLVFPNDVHWSAAGHDRIAELLYGAIAELDLLGGVALPAWAAADKAWRQLQLQGRFQAEGGPGADELLDVAELERALEPAAGGGWPGAFQVYGGVDAEGRIGPYACFVLPGGGDELVLELAGLGRPELPALDVEVRVEGLPAGRLELAGAATGTWRLPLPAAAAGRALIAVELQASEWVHAADDLRHCVSARLLRAALE